MESHPRGQDLLITKLICQNMPTASTVWDEGALSRKFILVRECYKATERFSTFNY